MKNTINNIKKYFLNYAGQLQKNPQVFILLVLLNLPYVIYRNPSYSNVLR